MCVCCGGGYRGGLFLPGSVAYGILVPWPGIEPGPLAVTRQSPNHWTAREFPRLATSGGQVIKGFKGFPHLSQGRPGVYYAVQTYRIHLSNWQTSQSFSDLSLSEVYGGSTEWTPTGHLSPSAQPDASGSGRDQRPQSRGRRLVHLHLTQLFGQCKSQAGLAEWSWTITNLTTTTTFAEVILCSKSAQLLVANIAMNYQAIYCPSIPIRKKNRILDMRTSSLSSSNSLNSLLSQNKVQRCPDCRVAQSESHWYVILTTLQYLDLVRKEEQVLDPPY